MAKTIRLSDKEEKALNEISLKLNRELVKMGKMPLRDTEIFHEIMEEIVIKQRVELNRDGKIQISV